LLPLTAIALFPVESLEKVLPAVALLPLTAIAVLPGVEVAKLVVP